MVSIYQAVSNCYILYIICERRKNKSSFFFIFFFMQSENIYDLFDKVLLLYDGHCIYFGPAEEARSYFINMGFDCPARQTTADFLTAVTDPHERKPAAGLDPSIAASLPSAPEQFEVLYKQSPFYEQTIKQLQEYEQHQIGENAGEEFIEASRGTKQKHVSVKNPYTLTFLNQVMGMAVRQIQLTRGDIGSLISRYLSVSSSLHLQLRANLLENMTRLIRIVIVEMLH